MNRKYFYCYIILFFLLFFLAGCGKEENINNTENFSASANRLSANISANTSTNTTAKEIRIGEHEVDEINEEEISSFSTKLVGKDTPRSRNIGITTSTLNGTIVKNGETFSFCETIGEPTSDKGYEEADSFDADGNTVQTLGGGNCQVSSTLYNAVLKVSDLQVKERHAHSKEVHYVAKDKDAAVSYGSVDFKFKNNTGNDIKIYASSDLNSVNIRIVKMN